MVVQRRTSWIAAVLVSIGGLAACNGEDDEPSDVEMVSGPAFFQTPSGDVTCQLWPDFIQCSVSDPQWLPAAEAAECREAGVDWGDSFFSLGTDGEGVLFGICSPEPLTQEPVELEAEQALQIGSLRCTSHGSSMSCIDLDSEQGFDISAEEYRVF
jgi:hypothetical protein